MLRLPLFRRYPSVTALSMSRSLSGGKGKRAIPDGALRGPSVGGVGGGPSSANLSSTNKARPEAPVTAKAASSGGGAGNFVFSTVLVGAAIAGGLYQMKQDDKVSYTKSRNKRNKHKRTVKPGKLVLQDPLQEHLLAVSTFKKRLGQALG